jgi:glycosyltransferase involved in cell wall biosynthesis
MEARGGVHMKISVVMTVYNEAKTIVRLLESLAEQTRLPDEVVICDGGSSDGTVQLICGFAEQNSGRMDVQLVVEAGANISRGRNRAIGEARYALIAVTDAGVQLAPTWLEELTQPWLEAEANGSEMPLAAAGFFLPDGEGVFMAAMAATVLPSREDIDPARFLPSSRSVAFLKTTWAAAGGYPEWLDYCEDLLFDFAVNGLRPGRSSVFVWRPNAVVYFRPRENLVDFWKQYYRYARGDGKADLWRKRHAIRYFTYLVTVPLLIVCGLRGSHWLARALGWGGLVAGVTVYCWRPWQRLFELGKGLRRSEIAAALLFVPVIRAVGDFAKMAGYPVGLWWRFCHRHMKELDWRQRIGAHNGNADRRPQPDRGGHL